MFVKDDEIVILNEILIFLILFNYMAEKDQLAVSYAAFILSGAGAEVTADSLNAVLAAANVTVNATLVNAVAKALKGKNVTDFFGSAAGSAPASSAPAPAEKKADKPAAKPVEAKKEAPPPPPPKE